jgi:hypothetical protein
MSFTKSKMCYKLLKSRFLSGLFPCFLMILALRGENCYNQNGIEILGLSLNLYLARQLTFKLYLLNLFLG